MSLILDALRKADAERDRGSVPSLHSQPVTTTEAPARPKGGPNLLLVAIGVAVGVLGAAGLWAMLARDPPRTAPSVPAVAAPPPVAATSPPMPAPAAPATPAAPAATPAPLPGSAAPVAEPAPWPRPEERAATPEQAKASPTVPVLGNVAPGASPVLTRDQLPPDIRAQLPAFTIGGSIYSPVPSARSLIVNGQLFREKDRLTPDLTLDEIKLKAAVFSFRGQRFEVPF